MNSTPKQVPLSTLAFKQLMRHLAQAVVLENYLDNGASTRVIDIARRLGVASSTIMTDIVDNPYRWWEHFTITCHRRGITLVPTLLRLRSLLNSMAEEYVPDDLEADDVCRPWAVHQHDLDRLQQYQTGGAA